MRSLIPITSDASSVLDEAIKRARAAYDAMSPVDRALHDDEQRRSFVRGQCGRDPGPSILAEEVRRLRRELAALQCNEPVDAVPGMNT